MYGPVCTVVWQGSAGDRRPYADQTLFSVLYFRSRLATTRKQSASARIEMSDRTTSGGLAEDLTALTDADDGTKSHRMPRHKSKNDSFIAHLLGGSRGNRDGLRVHHLPNHSSRAVGRAHRNRGPQFPSPNLTHLCIISVRGFSIYPCDMGDVE